MVKVQEISSDKNIIKNEKIDFFECCKIGNRIKGSIGINGNIIFNNDDVLIEFPYIAKTSYRTNFESTSALIYITERKNSLKIKTSNELKTKYYSVYNFEFYI